MLQRAAAAAKHKNPDVDDVDHINALQKILFWVFRTGLPVCDSPADVVLDAL